MRRGELSEVLYKIQQVKFFEEASEIFVSKTEKNGQQNVSTRMYPIYKHGC